MPAIVLKIAERCIAVNVDAVLGEQEVVVKGLGKQLVRVNCIAGCTIMASGDIVLILNVHDLIKRAARDGSRSAVNITKVDMPSESEKKRRILVVDDSITTRTLEKNILESSGYAVDVAINGQEALEMIGTNGIPNLMVVDVVMPHMNGFELTQKIKNDPHLSHIPVILVTSLDSTEDKAHGIEVGAEAYIVKSNFQQNNLLEMIEQLI
jgi:two-component system chemotaxis sensor kinase CheA